MRRCIRFAAATASSFVSIEQATIAASVPSTARSVARLPVGRRVAAGALLPPPRRAFASVAAFANSPSAKAGRINHILRPRPSFERSAAGMATSPPTEAEAAADVRILRERKQSLRKHVRSRIKTTYPPAATEKLTSQSDLVFSRLFDLPQYKAAKSVGFFLSMPRGEIQTRSAIKRIVADGKELFVPRVGLDFEACDMELVRCDTQPPGGDGVDDDDGGMFYDGWPRNKWGIPEPPVLDAGDDAAKPGDIDLLLVPGLAFDGAGRRLGQGKGYYDRFIARMRDGARAGGGKPMMLVGVCLEEQFLGEAPGGVDLGDGAGGIVPVSDRDCVMDAVLTPSRTLVVPKLL